MTDEQAQEIQAGVRMLQWKVDHGYDEGQVAASWALEQMNVLQAEVEQLRDQKLILQREVAALLPQNAAMREIVQAMANMDPVSSEARALSGVPSWRRDADLIAKARAILADQRQQ